MGPPGEGSKEPLLWGIISQVQTQDETLQLIYYVKRHVKKSSKWIWNLISNIELAPKVTGVELTTP